MSYVERWEKFKEGLRNKHSKAPASTRSATRNSRHCQDGERHYAGSARPGRGDKKQQRAPIAKAINKFMEVRGPYVAMLVKETGHAMTGDDMELATAYKDLQTGLGKISVDAGKDLEKVQAAKEPGKVSIPFFEIEGDVKATIAKAKKDLAPFSTLEKKYNVLAKADAALKDTEKYTKSAARTEYKAALEALTSFKADAKACADALTKVINAEKANEKFIKPVQSFHDAMKAFSTVTRVDQQIKL